MKKIISIFIIIIFSSMSFLISVPTNAYAKSTYLRVITEDTPFYKNVLDYSPLFYLPYTYYVKVLGEEQDFYHVEVYGYDNAGLDGFVPKTYLFDDGLEVKNPYLTLKITTAQTALLYADHNLTDSIQYIFPDRELIYYGCYPMSSGNVYCVSYNDKLGYVKEEAIVPFIIENHPNELTFLIPDTPPEQQESSPSTLPEDFFGLKVIIVVCLIFAGIIALFVALSKKTNKSIAVGYYDENDYE